MATFTFDYTGSSETFAVSDYDEITVEILGAGGEDGDDGSETNGGSGAPGGSAEVELDVSSFDEITIYVGGGSGNTWGYNNGGPGASGDNSGNGGNGAGQTAIVADGVILVVTDGGGGGGGGAGTLGDFATVGNGGGGGGAGGSGGSGASDGSDGEGSGSGGDGGDGASGTSPPPGDPGTDGGYDTSSQYVTNVISSTVGGGNSGNGSVTIDTPGRFYEREIVADSSSGNATLIRGFAVVRGTEASTPGGDATLSRDYHFIRSTVASSQPGVGSLTRAVSFPRSVTAQSTQADATVNRTYSLSRTVEATGQRADATLDWASTDWIINGRFVRELTAETRDWQQLTLTFRSTREIVQDVLRPLDQNAGKTSIITQADGSFRVADRSSGSNSVVATAPTGREDVRPITEWLVEEYSDTIIDQAGDRYEVTVELMSRESKRIREQYDDADAITVTPEDWLFEFDTGAFATSRIQYDIERSGSDGVETLLLTPSLTPRQVRILEENASKLEAVTIREVPDGANFVDDAAAENTVELTVPDGVDGADSGAYAIMEWETEWLNDAFYRVSLEMAPIQ